MPEVTLGLAGPFSHGRVITELLAAPDSAVGEGFVYDVGGAYWERPVALTFQVNAGEGDEVDDIYLDYLDGSGVPVVRVDTGPTITGPDGVVYSFLAAWTGAPAWSGAIVNAPLPPVLLQPTWSIAVVIGGTIDGTNLSDIRFYRERFITGAGGYEIGTSYRESGAQNDEQLRADELS